MLPPDLTPALVYVAGPFSAPTRGGVELNIAAAVQLGIEVAKLGAMPVIPHANTAHPEFESVQPYQFWIDGTMALLEVCGACIMRDGWEQSRGASGERERAVARGLPVFYSTQELRMWMRARELLAGCVRDELHDRAFGDSEFHWERDGELLAEGYHGSSGCSVSTTLDGLPAEFDGPFARPLLKLGKPGRLERNDSQGDDSDEVQF